MRNSLIILFTFISALANAQTQAQQQYIDSLKNQLVIAPERDTNHAMVLYRLCNAYARINQDSAEQYGNAALKLSMELGWNKGIGASYNNLGMTFEQRGEDVKALKYYILALDAKRKTGDTKSTASTLNNIGIIYKKQEYYSKALHYYREAMSLNKMSSNKEYLLANYSNIANCHKELGHGDSALYYYELGANLAIEINQFDDLANILNSRGNYYITNGQYETANIYLDSAYKTALEYNEYFPPHLFFEAKGRLFLKLGQLDSAEKYLNAAWELKGKSNDWGPVTQVSLLLSELNYTRYQKTGDEQLLQKSFDYLVASYAARDSLVSTKRLNTIFDLVTEDLIKQKDAEITSIQREKELVDLKAENERQSKNFIIVIAGAAVIVLLVIWQRYRKNKILNRKLAEQNLQIESKNKEIIDSITYAKRLQDAILPPPGYLKQFFAESFILYLPKDIVAGDFYWTETSGDRFFIAVADCTGHGVPGAMVSVVCANALDRSVKEFGLRDTAKILDKTRSLVVQGFEKSEQMVNDGMDISLLALSLGTIEGKAQWSGANNPLWIVRDGKIIELKGDKQPIGRFEKSFPFTAHEVELKKGDWVYLLTDGFADQFGGPSNKKFKSSGLKSKLIEISSLPAEQQREELISTLNSWRGEHEQVDDVCVVGIRV